MIPPIVISARDLTKRYGDLAAVDGVSFDIRRGECFGFLGPNGAGKTSTMRMISCVSPVTGGELTVDGMDVRSDQRAIKSSLGVVSHADSLDPDLSVLQNLLSHGRFFELSSSDAEARSWAALDMFQLKEKAHQRPDELSGGMRRRLLIARALLHGPTILVLDEPTTGLDPQTRHMVWDQIVELKSQQITVLLTSHNMEEAAYLCDRLVVMDGGRILVEGSPRELVRGNVGDQVVEAQVPRAGRAELLDRLRDRGVDFQDRWDSVFLHGGDGVTSLDGDLDGYPVVRRPANLEDVFLWLTGRGLRDE